MSQEGRESSDGLANESAFPFRVSEEDFNFRLQQKEDQFGLLNQNGQELLPLAYDTIYRYKCDYYTRLFSYTADVVIWEKGGKMGWLSFEVDALPQLKRIESAVTYDTIYPVGVSRKWKGLALERDGKFGLYSVLGYYLAPTYEQLPSFMVENSAVAGPVDEYWLVQSDGREGVMKNDKELIPVKFQPGSISYLSDQVFQIEEQPFQFQFFDASNHRLLDFPKELFQLNDNWSLRVSVARYAYKQDAYDDEHEAEILVIRARNKDQQVFPFLDSAEDLNSNNPVHRIVVLDRATGHVLQDYEEKGYGFQLFYGRILVKTSLIDEQKGKVKVELFDLLNGRALKSYSLKGVKSNDLAGIVYQHSWIYELSGTNGKTKGYLSYYLLNYMRNDPVSRRRGNSCNVDCCGCGLGDDWMRIFFWTWQ